MAEEAPAETPAKPEGEAAAEPEKPEGGGGDDEAAKAAAAAMAAMDAWFDEVGEEPEEEEKEEDPPAKPVETVSAADFPFAKVASAIRCSGPDSKGFVDLQLVVNHLSSKTSVVLGLIRRKPDIFELSVDINTHKQIVKLTELGRNWGRCLDAAVGTAEIDIAGMEKRFAGTKTAEVAYFLHSKPEWRDSQGSADMQNIQSMVMLNKHKLMEIIEGNKNLFEITSQTRLHVNGGGQVGGRWIDSVRVRLTRAGIELAKIGAVDFAPPKKPKSDCKAGK